MHFLRINRHASAVIVAVVLIVVGVLIGVTRHAPQQDHSVTLRADQQSLQPSPTVTVPSEVIQHPKSGSGGETHTLLTIGGLAGPVHAPPRIGGTSPGSGGGSTGDGGTTTATSAPGSTTGTTVKAGGGSGGSAFGATRIAYTAGNVLWTVNADGTNPKSVVSPGYFAAWAPDHSALVYSDADSPGGALSIIGADGGSARLTTGAAADSQPAWSPDGTKIAFARIDNTQPTEYSELWLVNRDGSGPRQLTHLLCVNRDPSWSPDGKKIVFWSSSDHCTPGPGQGSYELYVLDLASAGVTRLDPTHTTNAGSPAWSPDGKRIAYACDGEGGVGSEICTITPDGKTKARLTNLSGNDTDPVWSPDGKTIAFHSDRAGATGIYTMTSSGSNVQPLVTGAVEPAWD